MRSLFKAWRKKENGTVAVEFAMVGIPFVLLLVGIVETALFFAAGVVMEGAANDAARLIRTGQAQAAANPLQAFEDGLCTKVSPMITCTDLQYEVVTVPGNSFANVAALAAQYDADGNLVSQGFAPGGASDVVLVRVVYNYTFLTPFVGMMMTGSGTSSTMRHVSTVIVKNEPYRFGA